MLQFFKDVKSGVSITYSLSPVFDKSCLPCFTAEIFTFLESLFLLRLLIDTFVLKIFIYLALSCLNCGTQDLRSLLWHAESSSLTKDQTQSPCIGSMES